MEHDDHDEHSVGHRRVYRYGCLPPTEGIDLVRAQLRAAHNYRNDLVAIERGRRWALRQVDDTDEVREATELVKAATKNTRKAALASLRDVRRKARGVATDELARIKDLDESIRRDARSLTTCYWGSYLSIEAAHQQARQAPLYEPDGITPSDPKFVRWRGERDTGTEVGRLPASGQGQIGVQLQKGLKTPDALAGTDTRVRLEILPLPPLVTSRRMQSRRHAVLSLRVGSEGRDPIWARIPLLYHRAIPDQASWKWVRLSLRHEGRHERWSCEITVDDPATPARDLDRDLDGAIAVEWEWLPLEDGSIRVARWADDRGRTGEELLPARVAIGIRKTDGHRAVRDTVANDLRSVLQRAIQQVRAETRELPKWLVEAASTMHLWKSLSRLHALHRRWHSEAPTVATGALLLLDTWVRRDRHLWDYESGMRSQTLHQRQDVYRCLARRWASEYRTAILSDQDLSREARFGPDSEVRFTAGVSELRGALRDAFGADAYDGRWTKPKGEEENDAPWCERARDAWMAGGAREGGMFTKRKEGTTNAWAARRARAAEKRALAGSASETPSNIA
jgi:hypothetical protein